MKQERNINITDVDQMAQLRDKQALRLDRPFLDGWNSKEFLDVFARSTLVIAVTASSMAVWQLSSWSGIVFTLIAMAIGSTASYQIFRNGKQALGSIRYFAYFIWLGLLIGLNWHLAWADLTIALHQVLGGLL